MQLTKTSNLSASASFILILSFFFFRALHPKHWRHAKQSTLSSVQIFDSQTHCQATPWPSSLRKSVIYLIISPIHNPSRFVRAMGFVYVRFCVPPDQQLSFFKDHMRDTEKFIPTGHPVRTEVYPPITFF